MKPKERDDLLVRLDERTSNIWTLTEKQEEHLEKINNHLDDHSKRLVIAETQIKERTTSPVVKKMSKKAKTGYSGIALTVFTLIYYLGQARGWW